ncbi:MAG: shikimate dehydrogenase [Romboutsia sp.]|nr:shikimate dehydrogenase [Romboutsia sp.]
MGSPIDHSLSPIIHNSFAAQHDLSIKYDKIFADEKIFDDVFASFISSGGIGANITSPLKEYVFAKFSNLTDRCRHANSVNTLTCKDKKLILADNTDGIGFIRDIGNNNIPITNKNILILGAGGAARGILRPILGLSPKKVSIANRTKPRAVELVNYFKVWGKVRYVSYRELRAKRFDVIINATSSGLYGELPSLPDRFSADETYCYDMNYGNAAKPFVSWASANNALQIVDGLGMLVEQAAESFWVWNNLKVNTDIVIKDLRNTQLANA